MGRRYRVGLLVTHPIQYYAPWYQALARLVDLDVYYCHRQRGADHARSEFGVAFEWDVPLLDGYRSTFLHNRARRPDVSGFAGCDTPEIGQRIAAARYDAFIVQGWYVLSYWQAMAACWRSGTPLLVRGDSHLLTARSRLWSAAKALAYRAFIPRFAGYLVVGARNRDYYRHYGADCRRMFWSPHAVDNRRFAAQAADLRPRRAAVRAAWGLPDDAVVYLAAGKLVPRKRPLDFVRAVERAARENPRVWGLLIGEGPLRGEIEELVARRGLPVRLAGFLNQSAMPRAYAAADALVLGSDASETWGLVVNEAMACGLPALVSDAVGCAPDLVRPGETGAQFPAGDEVALAAAMGELAGCPGRLAELGGRAARHIQGYSIELAAAGTFAAVQAVAGGSAHAG